MLLLAYDKYEAMATETEASVSYKQQPQQHGKY